MRPICTLRFVGIIMLTALSFSISGKHGKTETATEPDFVIVKITSQSGQNGN